MKKYIILLFTAFLLFLNCHVKAQVSVSTDGSPADPTAMLDIRSTAKGLLIPHLTATEIQAIINPANSLLVYCIDDERLYAFLSAENKWKSLSYGTSTLVPDFYCGNDFTDSRDGKVYRTIQAGTQCWMAENLNTGTLINGINLQTNNTDIEKYCYENNPINCDIYGALYQWDEMMGYVTTPGIKGICPDGWHVPTDAEWCTLEQFVDLTITCTTGWRGMDGGGKLKEAGLTHWITPNEGATNTSGFTALPAGYRSSPSGLFYNAATQATFWTSTESNSTNSFSRTLTTYTAQIARGPLGKAYGHSVRCIRD